MGEYYFRIQSNIKNIAPLLGELKEKWEIAGLNGQEIFALHLAAEEALANAVKHGNKCRKDLRVEVVCRDMPDRIEIEITDEGNGFDYQNAPDPTSEKNIGKNSGRGIFLIRNFSDKAEFLEKGKKVKITKFKTAKENF